jgi:hypothetical protein
MRRFPSLYQPCLQLLIKIGILEYSSKLMDGFCLVSKADFYCMDHHVDNKVLFLKYYKMMPDSGVIYVHMQEMLSQ